MLLVCAAPPPSNHSLSRAASSLSGLTSKDVPDCVPSDFSFHSVTLTPLNATTCVESLSGNCSAVAPHIVISMLIPLSSASLAVRFFSSRPALVVMLRARRRGAQPHSAARDAPLSRRSRGVAL